MGEPQPEKPGGSTEKNGAAVLAPANREEIQKHVKDLLSDDYTVRAAAVAALEKYGAEAAEALVKSLLENPDHPHALANFSDALAEIGKPSGNVLLKALEHIPAPRRPEDVYLLESIVDLLGRQLDRRAAGPLLEQIRRLGEAIKKNTDRQFAHCCESAKLLVHRVLLDLGERGGLEDLLETLGDGRKRVRDGVVAALNRVGDRRALVPLVRLYDIEEHVSYSGAQFIKEAIREISRREHVTPDDRLFKDLVPPERAALDRVFPKARNGNDKH